LGHAKANEQPVINTRSYEEIVRASPMSDADKKYWLSED
jgi:hypothetical protein